MTTAAPAKESLKERILKQQSGLNAAERAVMMEDTRRLLAKEDAVADAHYRTHMGEAYQPPKDEDMGDIHVGDTIYYGKPDEQKSEPPKPTPMQAKPTVPPKEKQGMSTAAKIAAMGLAAVAGGSGVGLPIAYAISQMERPAVTSGDDTDTKYDLKIFREGK